MPLTYKDTQSAFVNRKTENFSKKLGIAEDEQIVLMIGVGMLKSEYNVPISNRLDYKAMVKEL